MRDTKTKSLETTALDMNTCNSSSKVIRTGQIAKVRRGERLGTKLLDCFTHYKRQGYDQQQRITNHMTALGIWQQAILKMESCRASHLWTERVKEQ